MSFRLISASYTPIEYEKTVIIWFYGLSPFARVAPLVAFVDSPLDGAAWRAVEALSHGRIRPYGEDFRQIDG